MKWRETVIETTDGPQKAIAPEVISASRSTDIPAYHAEWFMHRLKAGYVKWINPFNQKGQYISLGSTKVVVFWSKNPRPILPFLGELDQRDIAYYFQYTLNDYEQDGLEPGVPSIAERIETFKELSGRLGKHRVIWRFDPLFLSDELTIDRLLEKIERVGNSIAAYTEKLVFSFADISPYRKVVANLNRTKTPYIEFTKDSMVTAATRIARLCEKWGIVASTCAETIELSEIGVQHNRCVDDRLILRLAGHDPAIQHLVGGNGNQQDLFNVLEVRTNPHKDPGQRESCGCVYSKDIGQYNTCPHLCTYCYANTSEAAVCRNFEACSLLSQTIVATPLQTASSPNSDPSIPPRST